MTQRRRAVAAPMRHFRLGLPKGATSRRTHPQPTRASKHIACAICSPPPPGHRTERRHDHSIPHFRAPVRVCSLHFWAKILK